MASKNKKWKHPQDFQTLKKCLSLNNEVGFTVGNDIIICVLPLTKLLNNYVNE